MRSAVSGALLALALALVLAPEPGASPAPRPVPPARAAARADVCTFAVATPPAATGVSGARGLPRRALELLRRVVRLVLDILGELLNPQGGPPPPPPPPDDPPLAGALAWQRPPASPAPRQGG